MHMGTLTYGTYGNFVSALRGLTGPALSFALSTDSEGSVLDLEACSAISSAPDVESAL